MILERYGDAVELDLASTSYRLSMFHSGEESLMTLANLVRGFQRRSNSFLSAELQTDVEMYEARLDKDGNPPPRGKPNPDIIEESLEVTLLKTLIEQMQILTQITAGKKTPKVKPLPRPRDAESLYNAYMARLVFEEIDNALTFLPQAEFNELVNRSKMEN